MSETRLDMIEQLAQANEATLRLTYARVYVGTDGVTHFKIRRYG